MSKNTQTVDLECTSAFMVKGKMITPKQVVRGVPAAEAANLVRRGKAKVVAAAPAEDDAEAPALEELSVEELKATAKEYEIEGADKMKKAELVAAIEAAEAEDE
ncbi:MULTISPECIES: Rho termination factor N-terminal domain-containing protein [unclassified Halomonas]|uniref:Rho termination factor N-terminal domain-containing protein n=1 Tax=unclassified Halomonas TaxID=2609666 RepID=UPI0028842691|nr:MULTISPECIES: Rho termination factor N-terminal domain-containing protein [unclassified Halomonas]MDT0499704.1 Rho termination factor N-terminal domain-containing protein [Halomonas sp. PAR7]MDT0510479.1 Rho termination factor N-terminal domain-containing protein [Halomonas sp. LES1]MDT0589812.1 Rho termination factor N-terminal domain-containing protein [Halomonas sp. PAR8]